MKISFDPPADCDIAVLPDDRVKTRNGISVEADMEFYHCYTPTKAVAYRVLSDTAYRRGTGPWLVWVIGSRGFATEMNPLDFSTNVTDWAAQYKKRNKGKLPPGATDNLGGDVLPTNETRNTSA